MGRNLTHQMWYSPVVGAFDNRRFNLFTGNTSTMNVIYDWYGQVFDHSDLDFIGGAGIYSTIGEREPITSAGSLPVGSGSGQKLIRTDETGQLPGRPLL